MRTPIRTTMLFCAALAAALPGTSEICSGISCFPSTITPIPPTLLNFAPPHLLEAQNLVTAIGNHAFSQNVYAVTPSPDQMGTDAHIDWTGSNRVAITECSTFLTLLLDHTYGYTESNFGYKVANANDPNKNWQPSWSYPKTWQPSPQAYQYYDDVAAGIGFTPVTKVSQVLPGDTIAAQYVATAALARAGQSTNGKATGHVMTVSTLSAWQPRPASTQTVLANNAFPTVTGFYDITVIDSTSTPHLPNDTRPSGTGGIGRGVARFYVDSQFSSQFNPVLWTWSTQNGSTPHYPPADLTAFGRWIP